MQPQITGWVRWLAIETIQGTWFIPWEYAGLAKDYLKNSDNVSFAEVAEEICIYTEVKADDIESIASVWGCGARLSMPGYLDRTEWVVFDTQRKAAQYLLDMYGNGAEWEAELERFINEPT